MASVTNAIASASGNSPANYENIPNNSFDSSYSNSLMKNSPSTSCSGNHQFLYNNLQMVSRIIDQALGADQNLSSSQGILEGISAFSSSDYASERLPGFVKRRSYPIPKEIQDRVDSKLATAQSQGNNLKAFLGVFPELKYAWTFVGNAIYLWNFETGADFVSFDEVKEPIVRVCSVPPKEGIFVAEIQRLILVVTPTKVEILGVVRVGGRGGISLRKTGFVIPLGGFLVTHIASTTNGRIFLAGDDGHLYEGTYDSEERWFKRKCYIKDCTSSWIRKILPARTRDSQIICLSYDASRKMLHSLNNSNEIRIFDLADEKGNENAFEQIAKVNGIFEALQEKTKDFQIRKSEFSIISIHGIPLREGKRYFLIAVTSLGWRIYFHLSRSGESSSGDVEVSISHIRPAPEDSKTVAFESSTSTSFRPLSSSNFSHKRRYTNALCCNGIFIGSLSFLDETFSVAMAAPNYSRLIGRTPNFSLESWTESVVDDEVLGICEFHHQEPQDLKLVRALVHSNNPNPTNELLCQHFKAPLEFLLVTNSGIEHIRKIRPIDKLQVLLVESKGNVTEGIRAFFDQHKLDQSCAMCISLACEYSSLRALSSTEASTKSSNSENDISIWATAILARFGGEPTICELRLSSSSSSTPSSSNPFPSNNDIGFALSTPEISFSPLHNSLFIYVARIVRPILKSKLSCFNDADHEAIVENSSLLLFVFKQLQDLKAFIMKNEHLFFKQENLLYSSSKQRDLAIRKEKESILSLVAFIERMMEAISFYLFFLDHGSSEFIKTNSHLFEVSFESLVVSPRGQEISREIINAILLKEIKLDRSIAAMCETLKAKCPHFFSKCDIFYYQASEALYRALVSKSSRERHEMLVECLRGFCEAASFIGQDKFAEIAASFQSCHAYQAILKLGLCIAETLDPEQTGYRYLKGGKENSEHQDAYHKRCAIYETIFFHLSKLYAENAASSSFKSFPNKSTASSSGHLNFSFFSSSSSSKPQQSQSQPQQISTSSTAFDVQNAISECESLAERYPDSLFHWKYFEFCIKHGRNSLIIKTGCKEAEEFLLELFKQANSSTSFPKEQLELLYKFYHHRSAGKEASQILFALSQSPRTDIRLSMRMEYLSLAISTAKGLVKEVNMRDLILKELNEHLEVAKIQLEIISLIKSHCISPAVASQAEIALESLDWQILDFTTLYNKYAKPLGLPEAALLILNSANFDDSSVMISNWQEIIDRDSLLGMSTLRNSVLYLARRIPTSSKAFPLHFILATLCKICFNASGSEYSTWTVETILASGKVSAASLFQELERLYFSRTGLWASQEGKEWLMGNVIYLFEWTPSDEKVRLELAAISDLPRRCANLQANVVTLNQRLAVRFQSATQKVLSILSKSE